MATKPKIIVTGGAGYIGSHTVIDLIENGYEVVSIDNFHNSTPASLERIRLITGVKIRNYNIDLCNSFDVLMTLEKEQDAIGIIHFAAAKSVPESVQKPLFYYHNNLFSLKHLLQAADMYGIGNFVFSSSCSVYGNATELPVTENTTLGVAESPYARTKQMGEDMIRDFAKVSQGQFVLLRYFNPVGAHPSGLTGEDSSEAPTAVVPRITGTALGKFAHFTVFGNDYPTRDGTCIRDYIHVMDIAHAHTLAMAYMQQNKVKQGQAEVFNLGTGNGITVLEAIESFERVTGAKLNWSFGPRREGDVIAIYANNEKARTQLQWNPQYGLDDMMRTAWQWEKKRQQA